MPGQDATTYAASPVPDEERGWVAAARAGDHDAFGRLVRLYQRRAVAVAYRYLGNGDDAADVAQDAFIRAHTRLEQLDDDARFGPWLMRIVTNLSLNYRRKRKSSEAVSLEPGMEDGAPRGDGPGPAGSFVPGADETAAAGDLKRAIDAAIARLPEKQAAALVLFSIEGLPQKDVAEILECSIELVKWNVFQARKKLRDMLGDYL